MTINEANSAMLSHQYGLFGKLKPGDFLRLHKVAFVQAMRDQRWDLAAKQYEYIKSHCHPLTVLAQAEGDGGLYGCTIQDMVEKLMWPSWSWWMYRFSSEVGSRLVVKMIDDNKRLSIYDCRDFIKIAFKNSNSNSNLIASVWRVVKDIYHNDYSLCSSSELNMRRFQDVKLELAIMAAYNGRLDVLVILFGRDVNKIAEAQANYAIDIAGAQFTILGAAVHSRHQGVVSFVIHLIGVSRALTNYTIAVIVADLRVVTSDIILKLLLSFFITNNQPINDNLTADNSHKGILFCVDRCIRELPKDLDAAMERVFTGNGARPAILWTVQPRSLGLLCCIGGMLASKKVVTFKELSLKASIGGEYRVSDNACDAVAGDKLTKHAFAEINSWRDDLLPDQINVAKSIVKVCVAGLGKNSLYAIGVDHLSCKNAVVGRRSNNRLFPVDSDEVLLMQLFLAKRMLTSGETHDWYVDVAGVSVDSFIPCASGIDRGYDAVLQLIFKMICCGFRVYAYNDRRKIRAIEVGEINYYLECAQQYIKHLDVEYKQGVSDYIARIYRDSNTVKVVRNFAILDVVLNRLNAICGGGQSYRVSI